MMMEAAAPAPVYRTYRRRWLVLIATCALSCSNAMCWLTFAPVADQTARYFHISMDQVNWLSMVYLVVSIPFGFGTTWILDTLGLKTSLILSSWLNLAGCIVQLLSVAFFVPKDSWKFPLLMVGQSFGAFAQPLVLFSPTKVAALWFPEHQRATANMISSMANPLGILFANILSPLLMKDPSSMPVLLGVYIVPAVIACLLTTIGIRETVPPTPPSAGAANSTSEPFFTGIWMLMKNKAYVIMMICFGGGIGIFTAFSALLQQIVCVRGYSNSFAGICGALFIVFGILGAFVIGIYVDRTRNFMETTKINFCITALACIGFALVSRLSGQPFLLAMVCSLFGLFGFSIYPVGMELGVECSYPVGEGTSTGLIFVSGQLQGALFIFFLPTLAQPVTSDGSACQIGVGAALDWTVPTLVLAAVCSLEACCFALFFHTEYKRVSAEGCGENASLLDGVPTE
ncbi:solute carrier family 49 member A3 isoform X1 [Leucoraja erinacea]|uniref:solute carrier family 49 member A3 isoform X1 n=1 Tax=Leucoraja erinaceus TaxID=7782 RepID=UPI002455276D|nr:solute carrier family 49 member A3 isoform X1 [Leucoraja erinacea]